MQIPGSLHRFGVEMGVEDQDANERLHDRRLERDQFQGSSGSVRRMSPVDVFPGSENGRGPCFRSLSNI